MQYDIEYVIPHRGAMRLIDRLLDRDADGIRVGLTVPGDGLFIEPAGMPAWVGIEYMAQAIAAWAGCRARAAGREPPLGFLLGTRRYEPALAHFPAGAELVVEARCEMMGDNGVGAFACRILLGGEPVAETVVTVFEPPDAKAYLETKTP